VNSIALRGISHPSALKGKFDLKVGVFRDAPMLIKFRFWLPLENLSYI
jgi:hypothetical protein